jgi:hypothetical protein
MAAALLLTSVWLLLCCGYQMRIQQRLVEEGNRKQVGLWLRQHAASPKDTVFLEPLGYIGYFSQLTMLDVPGLSAPRVVSAIKRLKSANHGVLIPELQPDWLVLRPPEIDSISWVAPNLLKEEYSAVKLFDVSEQVAAYHWLPGRGYLAGDARFVVFKRNRSRTPDQSLR